MEIQANCSSYDQATPRIQISVKDFGLGIPKEKQQELFQPFSKLKTKGFPNPGTGLGLYISRQLAHRMGGDLVLAFSCPGEGSEFLLSLPATTLSAHDDSKVVPKSTTPSKLSSLQGKRILAAEDMADNQHLLKEFLSTTGVELIFTESGDLAVQKALNENFDLLLLDIQLEGMSGYEVTERLRSQGYTKPILAVTAFAMKDEEERCLSFGFSDYLSKPFSRDALIEKLLNFLA